MYEEQSGAEGLRWLHILGLILQPWGISLGLSVIFLPSPLIPIIMLAQFPALSTITSLSLRAI